MKRLALWVVHCVLCVAFWFRYKIEAVGVDEVVALSKKTDKGLLFLPNHVAVFIDPLMVGVSLWPRISARPLIVDYMYEAPGINGVMRLLNAISVPNFEDPESRVSRQELEKLNDKIGEALLNGDDFVLYPAGRLKCSPHEEIGGASMVHSLLQRAPECQVVLVRIKGLWGSSFSKAYTGDVAPDIGSTVLNGVVHCLKNCLFFTPRRKVIVEFHPAPADFPLKGSKMELNRWLEKWYDRPDGLTKQTDDDYPGDSFVQVSLSRWGKVYPEMRAPRPKPVIPDEELPPEIVETVRNTVSAVINKPVGSIPLKQRLGSDLAMDSIDLAEVVLKLQSHYQLSTIPYADLKTVKDIVVRIHEYNVKK